jgi:hypothetical protein
MVICIYRQKQFIVLSIAEYNKLSLAVKDNITIEEPTCVCVCVCV